MSAVFMKILLETEWLLLFILKLSLKSIKVRSFFFFFFETIKLWIIVIHFVAMETGGRNDRLFKTIKPTYIFYVIGNWCSSFIVLMKTRIKSQHAVVVDCDSICSNFKMISVLFFSVRSKSKYLIISSPDITTDRSSTLFFGSIDAHTKRCMRNDAASIWTPDFIDVQKSGWRTMKDTKFLTSRHYVPILINWNRLKIGFLTQEWKPEIQNESHELDFSDSLTNTKQIHTQCVSKKT